MPQRNTVVQMIGVNLLERYPRSNRFIVVVKAIKEQMKMRRGITEKLLMCVHFEFVDI